MPITLQDIHSTINSLMQEGYRLEEIEAFLINTDDLRELYRLMSEQISESIVDIQGKTHICGIKIIDSHYVSSRSIFKIFKGGSSQQMHSLNMLEYLQFPTIIPEKSTKKKSNLT